MSRQRMRSLSASMREMRASTQTTPPSSSARENSETRQLSPVSSEARARRRFSMRSPWRSKMFLPGASFSEKEAREAPPGRTMLLAMRPALSTTRIVSGEAAAKALASASAAGAEACSPSGVPKILPILEATAIASLLFAILYTPATRFAATPFPRDIKMAERGGFEPPVPVNPARRFSKPLPSATRPPLRLEKEPPHYPCASYIRIQEEATRFQVFSFTAP